MAKKVYLGMIADVMHPGLTNIITEGARGSGRKFSYAWSRLYKMLSAAYCVYAHRGWIGLKNSKSKV